MERLPDLAATVRVAPGDVLAGKYHVERLLGVGGMGVVVMAEHLELHQRVALKFLLPEAIGRGDLVARFMREGRAAAKIRSEHVARVTDVGTLDDGAPYLVMEYLEGRDLGDLIAEAGPLAAADAVDFLLQACEALAEAHAMDIVHRDLKPANLFLTRRADGSPCVKLLDFGLSKMRNPGEYAVTHSQAVMGSPVYMSPEQLGATRDVDARGDIWGVGVTLFQLLTRHFPFEGETVVQVVAHVMEDPPRSLRELRPDLPEALEAVINKCLRKDPAERFQHVGELASALAPFSPPRSAVSIDRIARVTGSAADRLAAYARPDRSWWSRPVTRSWSRPILVGAAGALCLVVAVYAAVYYRRVHRAARAAADSTAPATLPDGPPRVGPDPVMPIPPAPPSAPVGLSAAPDRSGVPSPRLNSPRLKRSVDRPPASRPAPAAGIPDDRQ